MPGKRSFTNLMVGDLYAKLCGSFDRRFPAELEEKSVVVIVEDGQTVEDAITEATAGRLHDPELMMVINTHHSEVEQPEKQPENQIAKEIADEIRKLRALGVDAKEIERITGISGRT